MDQIVFREFRESDVESVVRMWKDSLSGWPPGFFGGSEISSETVLREEKSSGKLFTVLALEGDRVVGYCMTSPYGGEPEASYVNLINVVPDMHGRGIGKALLLDAVSRSADLGLYRIDLHTWPANMKAVPLYKKAGFFWVPDSEVYMQNYMPFLLGLPAFRDFLGDQDWYRCFRRELLVQQDLQTTDSGRRVFTYWFRRDDGEFLAEFDCSGRLLSRLEYPGFRARLEVDSGSQYIVGSRYSVRFTGFGFDLAGSSISCGDSIECGRKEDGKVFVEPKPVRMGKNAYEPADRLTFVLPDGGPELGLGFLGVESVALESPPLYHLAPGSRQVLLDLKKLSDEDSMEISWSVAGVSGKTAVELGPEVFQQCVLDLPELEEGVHPLILKLGNDSYEETMVLVVGPYCGRPRLIDTRRAAVILGDRVSLSVSRKGGSTSVWHPDGEGRPRKLASFCVGAGPPAAWNSDLPKQTYQLELGEDEVTGSTDWPSRPGMVHRIRVRLLSDGSIETSAGVENNSDTSRAVLFRGRSSWSESLYPKTDILPMPDGVVAEQRVYNQLPDWAEDLSTSVSGLSAPWFGVSGGGVSLMTYFPGWSELEYDMPGTPESEVAPGGTAESPTLRFLVVDGDRKNLFGRARAIGWKLGDTEKKIPFFLHDLEPVMGSGTEVSLTHPLHGERQGAITSGGATLAEGVVRSGRSIKGNLDGLGRVDVGMSLAGRTVRMPVFLVDRGEEVKLSANGSGGLELSNSRITALVEPGSCGHVYSLLLDGIQYLTSAHPEPSEFCWEKPWFGGICPRISGDGNRPFLLQDHSPEVEEYGACAGGLRERGWKLTWKVDHKNCASLDLVWTVSLLPGVPVLRTSLAADSVTGGFHRGELDFRGFLQPGGSGGDAVLTCERFPSLNQGRGHSGSWTDMGKWARVSRGEAFVEAYSLKEGALFSEDYGKHGCHLSVFSDHERKRTLEMLWLFGAGEEDRSLASVFRLHR